MPTRLILTLLLILLAAVIAAAAIFFLLARPPGPASATPTPPHASGPSLTLVAETIVDAETSLPVSADAYLKSTLLSFIRRSVLRPQHYSELGKERIFSYTKPFVVFQIRCWA